MAGQSASFDDQYDSNASFTKNHDQNEDKILSGVIAGTLARLNPLPPSSPRCCIYKVSDDIRQSNKKAYTPQVISIGPFHCNNPKLRKMEDFKLRYLQSFTDRAEIKLIDLVRTIRGAEESVRECYSETILLESDDFVKMILVDASFIIELFWKNMMKQYWTEYDRMLSSWLFSRLQLDLILLENQLPFFIIEKIYNIAFPSLSIETPFIDLTFCQFQCYNVQKIEPRDFWSSGKTILHFPDLLRNFSLPPRERRLKRNSEIIIKEMRSTTQLARVGLKFKGRHQSNNCSPLELKYANGVLEIPRFQLDDTTEIHARNLVALEECHYREDAYITDYYTLLSFLIKTGRDLDLLVREQIIDNWLDGVVATSMINKLSENRFYSQILNPDYQQIAKMLDSFYNNRKNALRIMMAPLKREYFYNPWRGTATIGGILLLLLTVIQTVCALSSVKNWK